MKKQIIGVLEMTLADAEQRLEAIIIKCASVPEALMDKPPMKSIKLTRRQILDGARNAVIDLRKCIKWMEKQ